MDKNELVDKVFQYLYDNPDYYWNIREVLKQKFDVTDELLIDYVINILINEDLTSTVNGVNSHQIKQEGKDLIEKYKSYSKYVKATKPKSEPSGWTKLLVPPIIAFILGNLSGEYKCQKEQREANKQLQIDTSQVHYLRQYFE